MMPQEKVVNYHESFVDDGFRGLKTYLGNTLRGNSVVYDTPFAKGETTSNLLAEWNETLESLSDKWPTLYSFEQEMRGKVGPLSVQRPLSERMEDIAHYYNDILIPAEPVDERAIKAVLREFNSVRGLNQRSDSKTVDLMKKSTNSGAPYFTKRRLVIEKTLPITSYGEAYNHDQPEFPVLGSHYKEPWLLPAVIGWRGQEGGPTDEDVKQRVIWMFPFILNIVELTVYQPLIELCQRDNLVPAWVSMESVDNKITKLFDSKSDKDLVICTDFSRFDQHFNSTLQDCTRSILKGILSPHGARRWLADIYPAKYYIPLVIGTNEDSYICTIGKHGMASGSGGTNVDETLAHRALQYEAAMKNRSRLNPNSQCLGDDGILSYPGITVDQVVQAYESHGQECNPDKQYASTQDCVYLRRWHHNNYRDNGICVGVYSTMRALGRMRYLERFMNPEYWNEKTVCLRYLSILENVKYHPLREQFVQFCMKRDKYRLGIDIPGFFDDMGTLAEEAIEHLPDFMGYVQGLQFNTEMRLDDKQRLKDKLRRGLREWWIVKYLQSQR